MARIRTIKPEFFTSEDIVSLSPLARLLYIAIWCEADKEGRLAWKPKTFKLRYLPADACDVEALCAELVTQGVVRLYGDGLAYIPSFADHQHINPRESASALPEPDASARVGTRRHASIPELTDREEGKGREGKREKILSSGDDSIPAEQAKPKPQASAIPYDDILAAYHDALPMLPAVRMLSDGRRKKIKSRWHELAERQTVEYWRRFFAYAAKSDFLTGRNGKWTACNFDWLIEPANHLKVAEGNYENGSRA